MISHNAVVCRGAIAFICFCLMIKCGNNMIMCLCFYACYVISSNISFYASQKTGLHCWFIVCGIGLLGTGPNGTGPNGPRLNGRGPYGTRPNGPGPRWLQSTFHLVITSRVLYTTLWYYFSLLASCDTTRVWWWANIVNTILYTIYMYTTPWL